MRRVTEYRKCEQCQHTQRVSGVDDFDPAWDFRDWTTEGYHDLCPRCSGRAS